eukprot:c21912_g4_i1.p1 GENE.c21912_g4_i1~~c21912_g4_i1.p1  ORF type:complete len:155 (-),score=54.52 c21912_g4_i1:118-561(-)
MQNKCFVCSIDRYTFDRNTEGFIHHIKNEHNMWQYVNFFVYLNRKNSNDYTGSESYVKSLIDKNDASWFPVNQAMKLTEHLAKQEEAQTTLIATVTGNAMKIADLEKKVEKVLGFTQSHLDMLASIAEENDNNNSTNQSGMVVIGHI